MKKTPSKSIQNHMSFVSVPAAAHVVSFTYIDYLGMYMYTYSLSIYFTLPSLPTNLGPKNTWSSSS